LIKYEFWFSTNANLKIRNTISNEILLEIVPPDIIIVYFIYKIEYQIITTMKNGYNTLKNR